VKIDRVGGHGRDLYGIASRILCSEDVLLKAWTQGCGNWGIGHAQPASY